MLSELQKANIGRVFDAIDTDSSGVITRADFEVMAARITAAIESPGDSPQGRAVREGYLGWWEQIRQQADGDRDGEVTRDEYLAAVDRGLLEDPHYLDVVTAAGDQLFDAADRDASGALGENELVAIYGAVGIDAAIARAAFDQIDTDGDGKINRDEFRTMVIGAFASKGPEDPGSNALGNA